MRASIIVVAYNSRAELGPCLASIIAQMTEQDELIVVDNGSSDGSADFVQQHYPQARLIRCTNIGYAGGNNWGAARAQGEFLVILNPDTVARPGAIDALLAPLQHADDIAMTTACIVFMDCPDVVNTCGNTMHYTGLTYCRGAGRPMREFRAAADVDAVSGAAFAIRRSVFAALGGFDEQFFMYVEDTDLSWRARVAGYRCLYVPQAVIMHAYQPAYSPRKAFYLDRNRHMMLLKNLDSRMYWRLLTGLILAEIVTWVFLLLQGPRYWTVKPQVYAALWRQRHAIAAARRRVQMLRRCSDQHLLGRLTHRLEFHQLANRYLAATAAMILHPAFWLAQRITGIRPRSAAKA